MSYEINLIEGERGKLHVTSDDARTKNALMFGTGRKVFNMDHAFEATMPDSNTVRITSGVFYDNGMFIRIDRDRYVEVPVDNGLPGTYRNDLVCIRYERNIQTQLESAGIVVKKGEASETKAVDPAYSVGDVLDLEVHLDEFPLYRVALDGITPKLEPMFAVEDVMSNIVIYEELKEHLADDTPGYKHIPSGGSDGQILKWSSDGTAKWSDNILIDSEINNTSTNPVQNKVVKAEFDKVKSDLNGKANSSHTHTKSEVGLGNVDNTADANKNVKYATSAGSAPANGGNSATVNGHTVKSDVPANAKFTDTTYNDATTTSSGLMSASDKTTIENLKNGAVTGIKGNAEKEYRTGNVNITPENIGAVWKFKKRLNNRGGSINLSLNDNISEIMLIVYEDDGEGGVIQSSIIIPVEGYYEHKDKMPHKCCVIQDGYISLSFGSSIDIGNNYYACYVDVLVKNSR